MIHEYYAYYLGWKGQAAESQQEMAKCRELDPLMGDFLTYEAVINYLLSDYKRTIEVSQRAVDSDPNSWLAHHLLGSGYEQSGRLFEAIPEYQKAVGLSEGDPDPTASLAHAMQPRGEKRKQRRYFATGNANRKPAIFRLT
jgi:tetratricopeptide (TPR) repeat protein